MKLEQIAATPVSEISLREPVRIKPESTLFEAVIALHQHRRGAAIAIAGALLSAVRKVRRSRTFASTSTSFS